MAVKQISGLKSSMEKRSTESFSLVLCYQGSYTTSLRRVNSVDSNRF